MQGIATRKACDLPCEGRGRAGSPCPPVPGMLEEGAGDARRHGCPCALSGSQKWRGINQLCRFLFRRGRAEARPSPWRAQREGRASARPCGWKMFGRLQKNASRARVVQKIAWRNLGGAAFSRATDLDMRRG